MSLRILALDVETVPQAHLVVPVGPEPGEQAWSLPYEPTPEWVEEHQEWLAGHRVSWGDAIKHLLENGEIPMAATGVAPALHPTTAQVIAVNYGWLNGDGEPQTDVRTLPTVAGDENAEAALILETCQRIRGALDKDTILVTFNGKDFDIPMLRARAALLHGAMPGPLPGLPWRRLLYPWDHEPHLDLRILLSGEQRRSRGTLSWWGDAFGISTRNCGHEVFTWFREGNWNAIRSYGQAEGTSLVKMFKAVEPIL